MKRCAFCELPITDEQARRDEATVWLKPPKNDHAMLRQVTGRQAHEECVTNASRGIAPDQGGLFDEEQPKHIHEFATGSSICWCGAVTNP